MAELILYLGLFWTAYRNCIQLCESSEYDFISFFKVSVLKNIFFTFVTSNYCPGCESLIRKIVWSAEAEFWRYSQLLQHNIPIGSWHKFSKIGLVLTLLDIIKNNLIYSTTSAGETTCLLYKFLFAVIQHVATDEMWKFSISVLRLRALVLINSPNYTIRITRANRSRYSNSWF